MLRHGDWYFDFTSAFAYLQFKYFYRQPADLEITLKPVLFAGLLGHWEHQGPAEIPAKRPSVQTYCYSHWLAKKLGVPFRMSPAHAFNRLRALRLVCALDGHHTVVEALFNLAWGSAAIDPDKLKATLCGNTKEAFVRGVYGEPTFVIDEELF